MNAGTDKHGYTLKYSTPSEYIESLKAFQNSTPSFKGWPVKVDDMFPYADSKTAYWTGYYTSRPNFKKMIKDMAV